MSASTSTVEVKGPDGIILQFVRASQPSAQQSTIDEIAVPKEVIKSRKSSIRLFCTTCSTILAKQQTCQRCKSTYYCSKDCQRKDWSNHKATCTPVERAAGISKLLSAIVANDKLMVNLALAAAIDLDLANDKRGLGSRIPFLICVNLGIEPSNIHDFAKLLFANPVDPKLEGMVQFNNLQSQIPGVPPYTALEERFVDMWKQARRRLPKDDLVGMMEVAYNVNPLQAINFPFPVPSGIFDILRQQETPFKYVSAFTGAIMERPLDVASCLQDMNIHIRSDKKNQLQLRTLMTEADKEIIRGVTDRTKNTNTFRFIREKINREDLYTDIRLVL
ncbi:hypothetical protein F5I97DRAFT_1887694 [Phlebopus sp. FC_14]|nr:hypothetical protein F5I97DRAFT_1887694 [Phlebopus sp. FC_14]